jgi:hypothetical protein
MCDPLIAISNNPIHSIVGDMQKRSSVNVRRMENERCLWEIGLDLSHVLVTIGVIAFLFFYNIDIIDNIL